MSASPAPADWREPTRLRQSFASMDSLFPTAAIARGAAPTTALEPASADVAAADLLALPVAGVHGTVSDVLASTETDAWLVLHDGRVLAESYTSPMSPTTRHLLMSVSKSLVGVIVGALTERGILDPARPVSAYVPKLASSGYAEASLRDVLDMRTGVHFSEDYLDPEAGVCLLDEAVGWAPAHPGSPATLKEFLAGLSTDRPHGGYFQYRSCETDVLGWVIEAATGRPFADIAADLLWSRLGTEADAMITVDAEGTGMFDGGICATLRDLARFGQMLLHGGASLPGERIVSPDWVDDLFARNADLVEAFAAGPHADLLPGGHYRNQFWVPAGGKVLLCVGIHGQLVYVDRSARMVAVKLSSWRLPTDADRMEATLAMCAAIADHLAPR
ncbi:serine hydrolase domain-containing protein [Nocardioides cavernaquae]|uniref:Class C beta-lactamase-related serine hydrolase n=1 Tax=Nocardioides cavernaquae TaxID=2321396 RepID=A0A3A5H4Z4_9ACTN|nr:serine hydrolase [Nocardioides cavernaquae]RJS45769.1 class C beta-lactamase-related serine hydrolase [Nocardioides cavernaquae]